jgi:two-component system KDP operon response regulator KdpE
MALVVDDEVQIRRLLRVCLEADGYRVHEAATGQEAITEAAQHKPDVVVLDLGLPDMDGVEVLKRLREWSRVPVLVLSVRDREEDKIAALDHGADDYVTKPFGTGELLARLRVARRHADPAPGMSVFHTGALEVDLTARVVRLDGKEVTHRHILREVWGPNYEEQTHYLRVYMAHLREKLEQEPSKPTLLITEPGVGYRLIEEG